MSHSLQQKLALIAAAKKAGRSAASMAVTNQSLTPENRADLTKWAKSDPETEELLKSGLTAEENVAGEEIARHEYLCGIIFALNPDSEPYEVIQCIEECKATTLHNDRKANPLFLELSVHEGLRYKKMKLSFPKRTRTSKGGWRVEDGKFLIIAENADLEALQILLELRPIMQEAILGMVSGEMLIADLNSIAGWAAAFFDHLSILPRDYIERGYELIEESPLVFQPRNIPNRGTRSKYVGFSLPTGEILLILDTPVGRRLVTGLQALQKDSDAFWNDEFDIPYMIQEVVNKHADKVVDPEDLLRGLPGICACRYNLSSDQEIYVLIERRVLDGQWRCVMANPEGMKHLFGDDYTPLVWTRIPILDKVAFVLREGRPIHPNKRASEEHGVMDTVSLPSPEMRTHKREE